ncbi:hypothetical protein [Chryseosolibacter indicus]|uniref:DUF3575 domain-containing protein n=1 Tax=Chryseosolibacter indicus TaxID=2782351 RepID=A0ABS5VP51_9BACT|nr:hypothetical protein [Chryseosolibacter indicus]MBT1703188.1 hypothetical protein [Chryseosolibacter indicus]
MKYFILTTTILLSYFGSSAQVLQYHPLHEQHGIQALHQPRVVNNFPDSVRIELSDLGTLIVLESKRFDNTLRVVATLNKVLTNLHDKIAESADIAQGVPLKVTVSNDYNSFKKINIEKNTHPTTQLLTKEDQTIQLLPPGVEIFIIDPLYKIYVYTETLRNLQKIQDDNFSSIHKRLTEIQSSITGRKSVKARFVIKDKTIQFDDIKYYHPNDFVFLAASAGVGVLRSKIYPELIGTLGLGFSDRFNRSNHHIELSYSSQYWGQRNAEGEYTNTISSFLSIAYSKNYSRDNTTPSWFGLGAGLLVDESGDFDFYKGRTMKLFLITDLGNSKLSLVPEFYLTEDFKKLQFGVKLHYRF